MMHYRLFRVINKNKNTILIIYLSPEKLVIVMEIELNNDNFLIKLLPIYYGLII